MNTPTCCYRRADESPATKSHSFPSPDDWPTDLSTNPTQLQVSSWGSPSNLSPPSKPFSPVSYRRANACPMEAHMLSTDWLLRRAIAAAVGLGKVGGASNAFQAPFSCSVLATTSALSLFRQHPLLLAHPFSIAFFDGIQTKDIENGTSEILGCRSQDLGLCLSIERETASGSLLSKAFVPFALRNVKEKLCTALPGGERKARLRVPSTLEALGLWLLPDHPRFVVQTSIVEQFPYAPTADGLISLRAVPVKIVVGCEDLTNILVHRITEVQLRTLDFDTAPNLPLRSLKITIVCPWRDRSRQAPRRTPRWRALGTSGQQRFLQRHHKKYMFKHFAV